MLLGQGKLKGLLTNEVHVGKHSTVIRTWATTLVLLFNGTAVPPKHWRFSHGLSVWR